MFSTIPFTAVHSSSVHHSMIAHPGAVSPIAVNAAIDPGLNIQNPALSHHAVVVHRLDAKLLSESL